MPEYNAGDAKLRIVPDAANFKKELEAKLKEMKVDFAVKVNLSIAEAKADMDRFRTEQQDKAISQRVNPQFSRADTELAAWRAEQRANAVNIPVKADTSQAKTAAKDLKDSLEKLAGGAVDLGKVMGITALVANIPAAISAVASLSQAIEQLSGAALIVPGAIAAAGASFGTLALGVSGVKDAYTALSAASTESSSTVASQAQAVVSAQNSMRNAVVDEVQAQKDVTTARRDALNQLTDLNLELRGGQISEAQAANDVAKARRDLAKGGFKDQLDYNDAVLRVSSTEQRQLDVRQRNTETQQKANAANAKGVEGSDLVVGANERVVRSQQAVEGAQASLTQTLLYGDAAQSKAAEALKKLSPAAAAFVQSLIAIKPQWQDLQKTVSGNIFAGVGAQFTGFFNSVLPTLKTGMGAIATAWNSNIKTLLASLGSDTGKGILDRILGNTAQAQTKFSKAIDPLVRGIGTLTAAGTDALPRVAEAIGKVADRFANFIDAADKDGRLKGWIDAGLKGFGDLGEILINVGKSFHSIDQALGGQGLLASLKDMTTRMANFLASTKGQQDLRNFFQEAKDEVEKLKPFVHDLITALPAIWHGAHDAMVIFMPLLREFAQILKGSPELVTGVVTAFIAWKSISAVKDMATSLKEITTWLGKIKTAAPEAAIALNAGGLTPGGAGGGAKPGAKPTPEPRPNLPLPFLGAPFVVGDEIDRRGAEQTGQMPDGLRQAYGDKNPLSINDWKDLREPIKVAQDYIDAHPDDDAAQAWASKQWPDQIKTHPKPKPGVAPGTTDLFLPPEHATGGPAGAGLAVLHDNEFVHRSSAVSKYGLPMMHAINQGKYPHYDVGGPFPEDPRLAKNFGPSGGAPQGGDLFGDISRGIGSVSGTISKLSGGIGGLGGAPESPPPPGPTPLPGLPGPLGDFAGGLPKGPPPPGPVAPPPPGGAATPPPGWTPGTPSWSPGWVTKPDVQHLDPGSQGPGPDAPAPPSVDPSTGITTPASIRPGLPGLLAAGNNPDALKAWEGQTGQWLGTFGANTLLSFGKTLLGGVLGFFGLENSILSPTNSWNQAGQQALGGILGQKGLGSGSGDQTSIDVPGIGSFPLPGGGTGTGTGTGVAAGNPTTANVASFLKSMAGRPYISGGTSAAGTDCSGYVSMAVNAWEGKNPFGGDRMNTRNAPQWITSHGGILLPPGATAPPGTLQVGWYNHGPNPNDGHMAGTLPDGTNFESSGGPIQFGGAAQGAGSKSFDMHAYFPVPGSFIPPVAVPDATGTPVPTGVTPSPSLTTPPIAGLTPSKPGDNTPGGKPPPGSTPWTDKKGGTPAAPGATPPTGPGSASFSDYLNARNGLTPEQQAPLDAYWRGKGYNAFATGGETKAGPAILHEGEFVQQASAVNKYGLPMMKAINEGKLPHFGHFWGGGSAVDSLFKIAQPIPPPPPPAPPPLAVPPPPTPAMPQIPDAATKLPPGGAVAPPPPPSQPPPVPSGPAAPVAPAPLPPPEIGAQPSPALPVPEAAPQEPTPGLQGPDKVAPSDQNHLLPAVKLGIESGAAAIGNAVQAAASFGMMAGGIPGGGGGGGGPSISGAIQQAGKIVEGIANVGASSLVGTVSNIGGDTGLAQGRTYRPSQTPAATVGSRATTNYNGGITVADPEELRRQLDLRDAQHFQSTMANRI